MPGRPVHTQTMTGFHWHNKFCHNIQPMNLSLVNQHSQICIGHLPEMPRTEAQVRWTVMVITRVFPSRLLVMIANATSEHATPIHMLPCTRWCQAATNIRQHTLTESQTTATVMLEQGLTSHSTQFRSFRRWCFYRSDDPTNSVLQFQRPRRTHIVWQLLIQYKSEEQWTIVITKKHTMGDFTFGLNFRLANSLSESLENTYLSQKEKWFRWAKV